MADQRYLILAIAVMALATFATRALPFLLLRGDARQPLVLYLGRYLPPAVMTALVIYSLKDVPFAAVPHGAPQLLAIAVTAGLHLWKRNALLSIGVGTGLFMWMTQSGFLAG